MDNELANTWYGWYPLDMTLDIEIKIYKGFQLILNLGYSGHFFVCLLRYISTTGKFEIWCSREKFLCKFSLLENTWKIKTFLKKYQLLTGRWFGLNWGVEGAWEALVPPWSPLVPPLPSSFSTHQSAWEAEQLRLGGHHSNVHTGPDPFPQVPDQSRPSYLSHGIWDLGSKRCI